MSGSCSRIMRCSRISACSTISLSACGFGASPNRRWWNGSSAPCNSSISPGWASASRRRSPAGRRGGQRRRAARAPPRVLEPQILMFDEPLSNLDLKLRIQMRDELRSLQRRLGKTSIYVTHDQTEALALSDRIAVLSHGRIEQIGTPGEIYEQPATRFVAECIGSSTLLPARVVGQNGQGTIVETAAGLRLCCGAGADGGDSAE